jgi:hypothetical protein
MGRKRVIILLVIVLLTLASFAVDTEFNQLNQMKIYQADISGDIRIVKIPSWEEPAP